jgi:hypothetical protein
MPDAEQRNPETGIAEGDYIARLTAKGIKPSKAAIQIDKEMPLATLDDLKKLHHWMLIEELANADPQQRRELLSKMDTCPCCDRWLGHNQPPADDGAPAEPVKNTHRAYRRQPSFDF